MTTVCVDTNIWVYALTRPTSGDSSRHERAQQVIQTNESVLITPQIINELGFVLRRKQGWQDAELRPLIEQLQSDCRLHIPSGQWHLLALFAMLTACPTGIASSSLPPSKPVATLCLAKTCTTATPCRVSASSTRLSERPDSLARHLSNRIPCPNNRGHLSMARLGKKKGRIAAAL